MLNQLEEKILLGKFIELSRKRQCLSQAEAAQILELPRTTYQDREKGISIDIKFLRAFSEQVLKMSFINFISSYEHYLLSREKYTTCR